MNLQELRLHSKISWNKSAYIAQAPVSEKFATSTDLIECACNATSITRADFMAKCRRRENVTARILVANYLLKHQRYSLSRIGEICGGKDHATILHYKAKFINFVNWKDQITMDALYAFNQELLKINPNYKQL